MHWTEILFLLPVGIIYPPPEVRNIVDKTASFVARNGPEFEQRIKQNEINNPKFTFLNSGDPYNAYYQHKVEEIRDGKEETPPPAAPVPVKVKILSLIMIKHLLVIHWDFIEIHRSKMT